MRSRTITAVLSIATILALLFAVAGAGIYGSPWSSKMSENAIYAAAILVGPIASRFARGRVEEAPFTAGMALVIGAAAGFFTGLIIDSNFREVWGKIFAVAVWLPMLVIGVNLIRKQKSKRGFAGAREE